MTLGSLYVDSNVVTSAIIHRSTQDSHISDKKLEFLITRDVQNACPTHGLQYKSPLPLRSYQEIDSKWQ